MRDARPDFVYFDTLARLTLPPPLPFAVLRTRRRKLRAMCRPRHQRTIHARWLFRVGCALWARREACANSLYALLVFVNTRHVRPALADVEVGAIALYIVATYSRGPRRKTKKSWQRYQVCPFDERPTAQFVSELVM
ncbi:MAG: hypothetical protein ACJ74W_01420 [Pyrinomonadaceae bacterium]